MRPHLPQSRIVRSFLLALLLAATGQALAHAELGATEPAAGAVLQTAPEQVALTFSEEVEVAFSVFSVHRLDEELDMNEESSQQRLDELAAPLVEGWLDDAAVDDSLIPTTVEPAAGTASDIALVFAEELSAGHYVVVYRVLSGDTHPVEGYFTFTITD